MLHAHIINIGHPGTFNTELNKMLKDNVLQEMKFPESPPSGDILQITKMMPKAQSAETTPEARMKKEMAAPDPSIKRRSLEKNEKRERVLKKQVEIFFIIMV